MSESLFYYTSNRVLESWFQSEKIWATRSITSNDKDDTTYIKQHFAELKEYLISNTNWSEKEIEDLLNNTENFFSISDNISLRTLKDFIFECLLRDHEYVKKAINEEVEIYNSLQQSKKQYPQLNTMNIIQDNVLESIYKKLIEKDELFEVLISILGINDKNINKELFITAIEANYPYVICFSQEKDNRFFWESYTKNRGVCLEFAKEDLIKHLGKNKGALIADIQYEKEGQFKNIKTFLDVLKKIDEERGYKDICNYEKLAGFGAMLKNPYWKVENEVRAVFSSSYFYDPEFTVKENYDLKYKREYKTQDYIEIEIPKEIVKSIKLGPLNLKENLGDEIIKYFGNRITESTGKGVIKTIDEM